MDEWIGDIIAKVDRLGIADNTIIVVMGDNGPFMQYAGVGGISDRVYRGGKTDTTEGGIRVNAYMRWKGVLEPNSSRTAHRHWAFPMKASKTCDLKR